MYMVAMTTTRNISARCQYRGTTVAQEGEAAPSQGVTRVKCRRVCWAAAPATGNIYMYVYICIYIAFKNPKPCCLFNTPPKIYIYLKYLYVHVLFLMFCIIITYCKQTQPRRVLCTGGPPYPLQICVRGSLFHKHTLLITDNTNKGFR